MQEQSGPSKPVRVMLVADDPAVALATGDMLRTVWPEGLVISQTDRMSDAADDLLEHSVTCVLVDLGRDSQPLVAIDELRTASLHTPIIALCEQWDEEFALAAVTAGAQDCLARGELDAVRLGRAMRFAIERKRAESALAHQALHDPLTGLPNRTLFLDRLRVALDRSRRTGAPVAVMFLDVDGFKQVNDSLGHAGGDRLLTALAERFRGLLRPMDTVARYGGDEFTFLFEGLAGERQAALIAERISTAAAVPLAIGDVGRPIAVSIGVTLVADPSVGLDDVIRAADAAMYRAKTTSDSHVELDERRERRQSGRSGGASSAA